jgi:hypothetical protein
LTLDHRGREVRVYRPALMSFARDDRATFPEKEFQAFRRKLAKRDPAGCFGGNTMPWLFVLYFGGGTLFNLVTETFSWRRTTVRIVVILAFVAFAYLLQTRLLPISGRIRSRLVQEELLKLRRCASCAFDLSGAPEDVNGCRECPECGAAWKVSPWPPRHGPASPSRV